MFVINAYNNAKHTSHIFRYSQTVQTNSLRFEQFVHRLEMNSKRAVYALIIFLCIIVIIEIYIKLPNKPLTTHDAIRHEALINHHKPEAQLNEDDSEVSEVSVIVLWWTSFIDGLEYTKNCGNHICRFTGNRKYLNHAKTKVTFINSKFNFNSVPNKPTTRNIFVILQTLLFYGSNLDVSSLPLPRHPKHIWALFHEESPKNKPLLMYRSALEQFNLTATFSQHSDFPLSLQYLESYEKLIDLQYYIDVNEKNRLQSNENVAPILYLQSICNTMSDRDAYVAELMKYIRIDSFGKCLNNNKSIPKRYFQQLHYDLDTITLGNYVKCKYLVAVCRVMII